MSDIHYTNRELANIFITIADLMQIKGEVIYKILAYRKAAESLTDLGRDVNKIWAEDNLKGLKEIPGVGKAIAAKIDELLSTGKLRFYDNLTTEVPVSLAEMLAVPDFGPKKVGRVWQELGITTIANLKAAAQTGKLRELSGFGAKSEQKILAGIESLARRTDRISLGKALPVAEQLLAELRALAGVVAAEAAGSLRRRRETVGDLDLLVAAADSQPIMAAFVNRPDVARIIGHGEIKSSVEFASGLRAQLWVHPPERFGTALQYATGSKDHNVRLRELALSQRLSLSEHALTREDGSEILCATEEEVYRVLGLPWITPELREDRGELSAAQRGALPRLITHGDIIASLHNHSTWSDGNSSIEAMAQAAIERGLKVLAITDHSYSLGVTQGMTVEDVHAQRKEIDAIQHKFGNAIILLQGAEVEIRADGTLDYNNEVLAALDIVVASVHTSLRQPREKVTERLLKAIRNPHVDIIGHPTGRIIPDREGSDLDMDAVLAAAAETDTALEINANPARLDLSDIYARRAIEMGIRLSINTDAHKPDNFDLLHYGVAVARRAWVEPQHVINTWPPDALRDWLAR